MPQYSTVEGIVTAIPADEGGFPVLAHPIGLGVSGVGVTAETAETGQTVLQSNNLLSRDGEDFRVDKFLLQPEVQAVFTCQFE